MSIYMCVLRLGGSPMEIVYIIHQGIRSCVESLDTYALLADPRLRSIKMDRVSSTIVIVVSNDWLPQTMSRS